MTWNQGVVETSQSRRRAVRRAVRLDCDVHSHSWTGGVRFATTDVSPYGLWIDTSLPLQPGEPVLLRFTPPNWPASTPPLEARARVARAALARRRGEARPSGMGFSFVDMSPVGTGLLSLALRGLPPPLPRRVGVPLVQVPRVESSDVAPSLVLAPESLELHFTALAPLLTAGRLVAPPPAGRGVVIPFPSSTRHARQVQRERRRGARRLHSR